MTAPTVASPPARVPRSSRAGGGSRAPEEIIVHVGMTKAGSTAIQNVLDLRRAELLTRGVLFPVSGMSRRDAADAARTSGHLHLLRMLRAGSDGLLWREWDAHPSARRLLLSAENLLLDQADENLRRLGGLLGGRPLTILAVLRHQLDWLPARWRESVVGWPAEARSFDRYALDLLASGALDLGRRLERLSEILGATRVIALDYGALRKRGGLVREVMRRSEVALDPDDPILARRDNASKHTPETVEAVRRLNAALVGLPSKARRAWTAELTVPAPTGGRRPGATPLSPSVLRRIEEVVGPANARLAATHLGGAPLERDPAPVGEIPCERAVTSAIRDALARPPEGAEPRGAAVGARELAAAYDALAAARTILLLGCGDLALLAAGLPGKLVHVVESAPAAAWRLQAQADRLDLPSPVLAHAAPDRRGLAAGARELRLKSWFRPPDLLVARREDVGDAALEAAVRATRPARVLGIGGRRWGGLVSGPAGAALQVERRSRS